VKRFADPVRLAYTSDDVGGSALRTQVGVGFLARLPFRRSVTSRAFLLLSVVVATTANASSIRP